MRSRDYTSASKKIVIVYDAHLLSEIKKNKLLKTIEATDFKSSHYYQVTKYSTLIEPLLSRMVKVEKNADNNLKLSFEQKVYYEDNLEKFQKLSKLLKEHKYQSIIIEIEKEMEINKLNIDIYMQIVEDFISDNKHYNYINKYLKYSKRIQYSVDFKLQFESMIIEFSQIKRHYD